MNFRNLNLEELLDHKIFYTTFLDDEEEHGVSGICVCDSIFVKERMDELYNGNPFVFAGSENKVDNLICSSQHISVNLDNVKKIVFLGFNEFGNYRDYFTIIDSRENISRKEIFFYGLTQNIDTLYYSEKHDSCKMALHTIANGYLAVYFYTYEVELYGCSIREIILPNNMEMHIMAITVVCGEEP